MEEAFRSPYCRATGCCSSPIRIVSTDELRSNIFFPNCVLQGVSPPMYTSSRRKASSWDAWATANLFEVGFGTILAKRLGWDLVVSRGWQSVLVNPEFNKCFPRALPKLAVLDPVLMDYYLNITNATKIDLLPREIGKRRNGASGRIRGSGQLPRTYIHGVANTGNDHSKL